MSYENWIAWQRKVIREEALESIGKNGDKSPIYSIPKIDKNEQENKRTE